MVPLETSLETSRIASKRKNNKSLMAGRAGEGKRESYKERVREKEETQKGEAKREREIKRERESTVIIIYI